MSQDRHPGCSSLLSLLVAALVFICARCEVAPALAARVQSAAGGPFALPDSVRALKHLGMAATESGLFVGSGVDLADNGYPKHTLFRALLSDAAAGRTWQQFATPGAAASTPSWSRLAPLPDSLVPSPYSLVAVPQPGFDQRQPWLPTVLVGCTAGSLDATRIGSVPLCYYHHEELDAWMAFAAAPRRHRVGAAVVATNSHLLLVGGRDAETGNAIPTYEALPLAPREAWQGNVGGTPFFAQDLVSWTEHAIPAGVDVNAAISLPDVGVRAAFAGLAEATLTTSRGGESGDEDEEEKEQEGRATGSGGGVVALEFSGNSTWLRSCGNGDDRCILIGLFPFSAASGTVDFSTNGGGSGGAAARAAATTPAVVSLNLSKSTTLVAVGGHFLQAGPRAGDSVSPWIVMVVDAVSGVASEIPASEEILMAHTGLAAVAFQNQFYVSGVALGGGGGGGGGSVARWAAATNVGPVTQVDVATSGSSAAAFAGRVRVGRVVSARLRRWNPSSPGGAPDIKGTCPPSPAALALRLASSTACSERIAGAAADFRLVPAALSPALCEATFGVPAALAGEELFLCVSSPRCPASAAETPRIPDAATVADCLFRGGCVAVETAEASEPGWRCVEPLPLPLPLSAVGAAGVGWVPLAVVPVGGSLTPSSLLRSRTQQRPRSATRTLAPLPRHSRTSSVSATSSGVAGGDGGATNTTSVTANANESSSTASATSILITASERRSASWLPDGSVSRSTSPSPSPTRASRTRTVSSRSHTGPAIATSSTMSVTRYASSAPPDSRTASRTAAPGDIRPPAAGAPLMKHTSTLTIVSLGVIFAIGAVGTVAVIAIRHKFVLPMQRRSRQFDPATAEVVHDSVFLDDVTSQLTASAEMTGAQAI